jgi:uncharacterized protein GlcG (DUF336 family)
MSRRAALVCLLAGLTACGGGGGGGTVSEEQSAVGASAVGSASSTCAPDCNLASEDVEKVISQAVAEASARGVASAIAVVDRVGNVLGYYEMTGVNPAVTITSTHEQGAPVTGGLENLNFVPVSLAAIAKAVTGAYLSTSGNAFSTRTASQIVQENFNPGERDVPSGPLFGVQFSNLPCSDFSARFNGQVGVGPHRSPLGLSADPGGFPLYIDGVVVGGVGVLADGIYGLDKNIGDYDNSLDEYIAAAAAVGYAAPVEIRADQISLIGKTGRFSDVFVEDLLSDSEDAESMAELARQGVGSLVAVAGYYSGEALLRGTTFGKPDSGIRAADPQVFRDGAGESLDAFVFVDADNRNRFPARDATDAPGGFESSRLVKEEVQTILNEALAVANRSRAQIRVPAGTQARVTVSIVDTNGVILAMGRTRDGPMFGSDVSLQKARTATFFSGSGRLDGGAPADVIRRLPSPVYLAPLSDSRSLDGLEVLASPKPELNDYIRAVQDFLGKPNALEGAGEVVAFSDRSGGNLSRPHYPDGPSSGPHGPLSKTTGEWSVFSTGFQSDLIYNAVIQHVAYVLGVGVDVPANCTGNTGFLSSSLFTQQANIQALANGVQIFPGSVPIFRGNILVGGIGVSGDGVDQDDMISFLGLHQAGQVLQTGVGNAPPELRADQLTIPGQSARLRYVNCPQAPFIDSDETEVCSGI